MKTIKGQRIALIRNRLSEYIENIIPYTSEYFLSWHSHDTFGYPGEPYVVPNSIYVFTGKTLNVSIVRGIDINYDDYIPNVFLEVCKG